MNRAAFFASLRASKTVFGTSLSQGQVLGCEAILDECRDRGASLWAAAYILATGYGETGRKMQPVRENLNYTTVRRLTKVWPSKFKTQDQAKPFVRNPQGLANHVYNGRLGNCKGTMDGWDYRGAGIGQITGRGNYRKVGKKLGIDLENHPEFAMQLGCSVKILVGGMLGGWFTGHSIGDYTAWPKPDYLNARQTWNGMFEAGRYAEFARAFEAALVAGDYQPRAIAKAKQPGGKPARTKQKPVLPAWLRSILGVA